MSELEQKIIGSTKNRAFLKVLYDEYLISINEDYELSHLLTNLHNRGKIDLIFELQYLVNDNSNIDFFSILSILEDVLPIITSPVEEVKNCVKDLTIKAGNDGASYILFSPFIKFCSKDINRADELLKQELEVIDYDFDHISTALISGYDIDKITYFYRAIRLLGHESVTVVQRVIFALSRFDYTEEPKLVVVATKEIITCTKNIKDEQILSTATNTLITLLAHHEELEPNVIEFIEHNIGNNNPDFIFRIAQQLNYRHKTLSEKIQNLLFSFFKNLNIEHKGIINQIDWYIYKKISNNDVTTIVKPLEYLLANNNRSSFQIGMLRSSLQKLQTKDYKEMLSIIFTRWLLKREIVYCTSAVKLLKNSTTHETKIEFDNEQVKAEDLIYLANKSIGWFSFQPTTALSLILSIIPICSDSQMKLIEKNTFNYIALNYSSQTKSFLQEHLNSSDKNTMDFSKIITKQLEDFLKDFSNLHEIKELRPSIKQRNEYGNYQQKLFEDASSEPNEELFFSSLFTKRVTLYGNKFIHKQQDFNGEMVRQVMPFSKMSHSIDFPSLANLTPHTLQYFLYKFQFEELVNETNP